jgi:chromosomal replication initiation ATPase DnaA
VTAIAIARQIVLDLPASAPRLTRDAFLVSQSNQAALATLERWKKSAEPLLVICGPAGAGKTHLAGILALETSNAAPLVSIIDDVDRRLPAAEILETIEDARARGERLVLAGRDDPRDWAAGLKDLETRLGAAVRISLEEPDEALLRAVILKLFRDRQLRANEAIADYAVHRIPKTFVAAQRFVSALDAASIEKGKPVGLKLAREIVANLSEEPSVA